MSKLPLPRVAVLGAGPVGLEAAVHARAAGLPVTVYEQGPPAAHVDRWGFARMFTPFGWNSTPLGRQAVLRDAPTRELPADADLLTGREFRDAYLVPLAESSALRDCVKPQTRVVAVGRAGWRKTDPVPDPRKPLPPFRLLVRDASGAERIEAAGVVLDCTGTYGTPNPVGDGGVPAVGELAARPHVPFGLEDVLGAGRGHYANKSVLVVGGGFSAAATVCDLAALAADEQSTWVIWLTHGPRAQPLTRVPADPLRDRDRLAAKANQLAARGDGHLEYHPQARVDELVCHGPDAGFRVAARVGGKAMSWEVERVVAAVGHRPDGALAEALRPDEPGYYVLGAKGRGPAGGFLLRDGHDQVRRAVAAAAGKRAA